MTDRGTQRTPESYKWPLVAIVVVILPQVLVPSRDRIGPPLLVPIVETADFQFPQTVTSGLAAPGWLPRFPDHLYVAFTNLVAFSPTDTMPLTVRAKALMALQSIISVAVLVVVLARVINILPS